MLTPDADAPRTAGRRGTASAHGGQTRASHDVQLAELAPWIELRFVRSAGPGGENVNKLSTRAELLFDFQACPRFDHADKALIRARLGRRLGRDGRLRVIAQAGRTQSANRARAERRLIELLAAATHVDAPRRPTRPTAAARARRLSDKRRRSEAKRTRRPPASAD